MFELYEMDCDSESVLQGLLVRYPSFLMGQPINADSPQRWQLITRTMAASIGEGGAGWMSPERLFLDQDIMPTLVGMMSITIST